MIKEFVNMNPYEMRYQLLRMARENLELAQIQNNDHRITVWQTNVDYAKQCGHPPPAKPDPVPLPTTEQIMAEAEKLYKFVSTK
jgi:hypothetical protein